MTNDWQGPMAKQVEIEGQKLEDVAKKWVDANEVASQRNQLAPKRQYWCKSALPWIRESMVEDGFGCFSCVSLSPMFKCEPPANLDTRSEVGLKRWNT
jgi:hypothetical protein